MARPDIDLATNIASAVASLTLGVNLFYGPVRDGDDLAVFCILSGGPTPSALLDGTDVRFPNVSIRIRGKKGAYGSALDTAIEIRNSVHKQALTGYTDVRVREATPNYLGPNRSGQDEWSLTAELRERVAIGA